MFNIGSGAILAVMGWFARQLWDAVAALREDIHRIEIDMPSNYLRRDEFAENMREIKDMLGKIFDRLDTKADKH